MMAKRCGDGSNACGELSLDIMPGGYLPKEGFFISTRPLKLNTGACTSPPALVLLNSCTNTWREPASVLGPATGWCAEGKGVPLMQAEGPGIVSTCMLMVMVSQGSEGALKGRGSFTQP